MKIENTSERRYELYWRMEMVASIPRRQVDEATGAVVNGSAEISDEAWNDLVVNHPFVKGLVERGELLCPSQSAAPVAVVSPADFAAPADLALSADKGKSKK